MSYKPQYFTLKEMCASAEAEARKIDNFPTFEVTENLLYLIEKILDPLRKSWGKPIKVTSGYRCKKLNDVVGGVNTSAHLRGDAADIVPTSGSFDSFSSFILKWFEVTGKTFDQLILEKDRKGNQWIHIGIKSSTGTQREEIKNLVKK